MKFCQKSMANTTTYTENICKEYLGLLHLADGELKTEDGYSFPIHKVALAKYSKYFLTLFCGPGKGKRDYLIPEVRGDVLSIILSYFYTERIHVTEENICDIIISSNYLLIDSLIHQTKALLKSYLSVNNCVVIYHWLMQLDLKDCLKVTYRFMQIHFQEIVHNRDTDLCKLPLEILKTLLNDRNVHVEQERIIWQAIVRWVEYDLPNRLSRVPDLLIYLRITDVDEKLAAEVLTHVIVEENTFCRIIKLGSTAKYRVMLEFHQYNIWSDTQDFPFYIPRKPLRLTFIANYNTWLSSLNLELYITLDESIDFWRKIVDVDFNPDYLVSIGDCMYLFNNFDKNMCYNFMQKKWYEFKRFRHPRLSYAAASSDGYIYIIGGISIPNMFDPDMSMASDVEIYNPKEDTWRNTMPMLPNIIHPKAVILNGCIYVVGTNATETGMSAQIYDPSTEIWNELPRPTFYRNFFAIVSFKEKIYVIGGQNDRFELDRQIVKNVEVFDPLQNIWYSIQSLPYTYSYPRALIINDVLLVSEKPHSDLYFKDINPPVQWNTDRDSWETIEDSSPYFNVHNYSFRIQEGDCINNIAMENKKPTTVFEKSPFF